MKIKGMKKNNSNEWKTRLLNYFKLMFKPT
jgi:hypothetical protein